MKFTYSSKRKPDNIENKVYAKIYAVYNGETEDLRLINDGRLVNNDSWSTEFKLKKPESYEKDQNRTSDAAVEYYAVIENKYATNNNFKSDMVTVSSQENVEIEFSTEVDTTFSDLSFLLQAGEEVVSKEDSFTLEPGKGELEVQFNTLAMNVQNENSSRYV